MANGNGKNGNGVSELPGFVRTNLPHWMQAIGVLAMLLGYGYQKTAEQNPDAVAPYAGMADWGAIAGLLITGGGIALNHGKDKAAQAVVEAKNGEIDAAAAAPPIDANGKTSAWLTASTAMSQAAMERNIPLMKAIADALEMHLPPKESLLSPGHPDAVAERGAA